MLFWLYLWQLKEYHIGRFLAHFQTAKGRRLLLNPWAGAKLILLLVVLFIPNAIFLLIPLYAVEFFLRKAPKPVFTRKIQFLTLVLLGVSLVFAFLGSLVFLLIIDILTPLVVSVVVLGFQPFAVLARNRIIAQAKEKQKDAFLKHIAIAEAVKKPLMLHCRPSAGTDDAYEDILEIISNYQFPISKIVHFYVGSLEMAKKLLDAGFSFTFGS